MTSYMAIPLMAVEKQKSRRGGRRGGHSSSRGGRGAPKGRANELRCFAVLMLFNRLGQPTFDAADKNFTSILGAQAVPIVQNALRAKQLHTEQQRSYELMRSVAELLRKSSLGDIMGEMTRITNRLLHVDSVNMFVVRTRTVPGAGGGKQQLTHVAHCNSKTWRHKCSLRATWQCLACHPVS